jgi:hypothetical protein
MGLGKMLDSQSTSFGHCERHHKPYFDEELEKILEVSAQLSLYFFLQLRGPATALSRKFLHDLKTARHFKKFFSKENFSCAATIQCAREHFSYCAVSHPRSLEGTLSVYAYNRQ